MGKHSKVDYSGGDPIQKDLTLDMDKFIVDLGKDDEEKSTDVVEETVEEASTEPTVLKRGVVTLAQEYSKLNVRTEPTITSEVITTVAKSTEVEVDESNSTYDFYRVILPSGIEGYCIKEFITITD